MKIIAVTSRGYLIESGEDELANLMGYYNDYQRTNNRIDGKGFPEKYKIGDEIPIHAMYDRLYRMTNMERDLTEISAKLRASSDFVNTALPTIKHVNGKEGDE